MSKARQSDRPYLRLVRQPQGLVPWSRFDSDRLDRYRIGAHLICDIEQPKDDGLMRRFHGLVQIVSEAMGNDFESLKSSFLYRAGFYKSIEVSDDNALRFIRASTRDMEQPELQSLFDNTVEIVVTEMLPHIRREDLIAKIMKYIEGK